MQAEYRAGDPVRRYPFNPHATFCRELAAMGFYKVVNPIDGGWTTLPLAPLMAAPEVEVLRGFKPHGNDSALRALLETSDRDFDASLLSIAQLQSIVSGWESASAELSENEAQFLRVMCKTFLANMRGQLSETGTEMPNCDLARYSAAVYTYLTDVGGRADDQAAMEVVVYLNVIDIFHRCDDPSSEAAERIMDPFIREG